jgi:hypothetical protein
MTKVLHTGTMAKGKNKKGSCGTESDEKKTRKV